MSKSSQLIYSSSSLKTPASAFPPQLQPAAHWLLCQAEAVSTKTMTLGSVLINIHVRGKWVSRLVGQQLYCVC